jgi:hypothetical protein
MAQTACGRRMSMCNALILSMLAVLAFESGSFHSVLFWLLWIAGVFFNSKAWKKYEREINHG